MSKKDFTHVSTGRTPWRAWMQLRRAIPIAARSGKPAPPSLVSAARRVQALSIPQPWQEDEARSRFVALCEWLAPRLAKPVHVRRMPDGARRIEVFEGITYTVRPRSNFVVTGKMVGGRCEPIPCTFELGRPLASPRWLDSILEHLDLGVSRQANLFLGQQQMGPVAKWVADTTYNLLLREPAFRRLRVETLPKALALPRTIYALALTSRTHPVGPLLESTSFNIVWKNEKAFRQVARENPQLLPLLLAYALSQKDRLLPAGTDPVAALKGALREAGRSEAAWRYVCRHGSRLFRLPWAIAEGQPAFVVAVRYLDMLDAAGLPPPPPPNVVKALLHSYNDHDRNQARMLRRFHVDIAPAALRTGLLEADRRRREGGLEGFEEELLGVLWWSEWLGETLDVNQASAGWSWFVNQWRKLEAERILLAAAGRKSWTPRLAAFNQGGLRVVPISTSDELVREALSMRNCLNNYQDECLAREMEIYSVRDRETDKRKACIGFIFDEEGYPTLSDVKGFANTPPTAEIDALAGDIWGMLLQRVEAGQDE